MEKNGIGVVIARAMTKNVRIAPSKAQLAARLIRGKDVVEAFLQLKYSPLKGSRLLRKTLRSAVANAENQTNKQREDLVVAEVRVDKASNLKRAWAGNKGRRKPILHRFSHFVVCIGTSPKLEKIGRSRGNGAEDAS